MTRAVSAIFVTAIAASVPFALGHAARPTPTKLDGKRHTLKVELSEAGKQKYKNSELKARPEYIPAN